MLTKNDLIFAPSLMHFEVMRNTDPILVVFHANNVEVKTIALYQGESHANFKPEEKSQYEVSELIANSFDLSYDSAQSLSEKIRKSVIRIKESKRVASYSE